MATTDPRSETESRKRLMLLMTRHQRQVFSYIFTLVPDRHDADDILQETALVICEKFDQFRDGTDFVAWACQIAWWKVRESRQKFARSKVTFNDDVLEAVAKTAGGMAREMDLRHEALANCLAKLHPRDRQMVMARYEPGGNVPEAAKRSGRSVEAAYKALSRLRKLLLDCISSQLTVEGAA